MDIHSNIDCFGTAFRVITASVYRRYKKGDIFTFPLQETLLLHTVINTHRISKYRYEKILIYSSSSIVDEVKINDEKFRYLSSNTSNGFVLV